MKYFAKRTFQVFFSVFFTLGPFILIGLLSSFDSSQTSFWAKFDSFFSKGQVSFMVISICGLIIWNGVYRHKNKTIVLIFVSLAVVLIGSSSFFVNSSTSNTGISDTKINLLWLFYIASLVIWWLALLGTDDENDTNFGEGTNERVKKLMKQVSKNGP